MTAPLTAAIYIHAVQSTAESMARFGYCAARRGYDDVACYTDEDAADRPALIRLLDDVESGEIHAVITDSLAQFGEDRLLLGHIADTLTRKKARLIVENDGIDGEDSPGFAPLLECRREWRESERVRKLRDTLRARGKAGETAGKRLPYGYRKSADGSTLVIDDEPAAVVRRIFDMALRGMGNPQIARELAEDKVESPAAYAARPKPVREPYKWSTTSLNRMLSDMEYYGCTVRLAWRRNEHGSSVPTPKEEWAVCPDTHEPIISRVIYNAVQTIRAEDGVRTSTKSNDPFSGLAFCADCGGKMYRDAQTDKRPEHYTCGNSAAKMNKGCTTHYIRADELRRLVFRRLREVCAAALANEGAFAERLLAADVSEEMAHSFIRLAGKHSGNDTSEPTPEALHDLIRKFAVHDKTTGGKERKIDVWYTYIGRYLDDEELARKKEREAKRAVMREYNRRWSEEDTAAAKEATRRRELAGAAVSRKEALSKVKAAKASGTEPDPDELGRYIHAPLMREMADMRRWRNIPQQDFLERSRLHISYVARIENLFITPGIGVLFRYLSAIDCTLKIVPFAPHTSRPRGKRRRCRLGCAALGPQSEGDAGVPAALGQARLYATVSKLVNADSLARRRVSEATGFSPKEIADIGSGGNIRTFRALIKVLYPLGYTLVVAPMGRRPAEQRGLLKRGEEYMLAQFREDVRDCLKEARKQAGLNMLRLTKKAGLSHYSISSIEEGKKTPSPETFFKLAAVLGIEMTAAPMRGRVPRRYRRKKYEFLGGAESDAERMRTAFEGSVAALLSGIRAKHGWTRAELAGRLGMHRPRLSQIIGGKRGKQEFFIDSYFKLLRPLGYTIRLATLRGR
jgi:transcriptional regulator with XRE-family HTH domain/DNA invertase Pin-like site-specific DNA recombinase